MRRKTRSLGSALAVTLSSTSVMAADFHSLTELQGATPATLQNAVLVAKERRGKCVTMGYATAGTQNAGGFCEGSELSTPTTIPENYSVANDLAVGAPQSARVPFAEGDSLSESRHAQGAGAPTAAKCVSVGGSSAGATGDAGAFCLASDISTSATPPANFSVANGLPVEGLQFLQVTFRDGSKLVGSRRFPVAGVPMGAKCVSVGGSNAGATGGAGDFCLASDLITSATPPANFSVANSLPVASLQFLQVTFRDNNPLDESRHFPDAGAPLGAKCASVSGSTATTGDAGGFCLVSDLSTSPMDLANFSVANDLPVAGLQFLQVTFRDSNPPDESGDPPGTGMPMGAECVSVDGSTASNGDTGEFCVVSDLSTLTAGFANFSMANDLPVAGMQFLQVMFGDGSAPGGSAHSPECVSDGGSTSATGKPGGSCLVSDRLISKTSYANFSVANALPVAALQFVQVPFRDSSPLDDSRRFSSAGAPTGVIIPDPAGLVFHRPSPPVLAGIADHPQHYFRVSKRRSGIKMHLGPHGHHRPHPVFWLGR